MTRRHRKRAAVLAVGAVAALMVAIPGAGMASTATTEKVTPATTTAASGKSGDTLLVASEETRSTHGSAGVDVQVLQFTKPTGLGTMNVITCYGQSDYPHVSAQQPGTVHGKARSWCTAPVPEVHVQAELWRYLPGWGYTTVGIGGLDYCMGCTGAATPRLQSIAIDICQGSTQYYYTRARHFFVAPAGYSPATLSFPTGTPGMAVTC